MDLLPTSIRKAECPLNLPLAQLASCFSNAPDLIPCIRYPQCLVSTYRVGDSLNGSHLEWGYVAFQYFPLIIVFFETVSSTFTCPVKSNRYYATLMSVEERVQDKGSGILILIFPATYVPSLPNILDRMILFQLFLKRSKNCHMF